MVVNRMKKELKQWYRLRIFIVENGGKKLTMSSEKKREGRETKEVVCVGDRKWKHITSVQSINLGIWICSTLPIKKEVYGTEDAFTGKVCECVFTKVDLQETLDSYGTKKGYWICTANWLGALFTVVKCSSKFFVKRLEFVSHSSVLWYSADFGWVWNLG